MKKILSILFLIVLASCGNQTRLQKLINETDVVKVYIYNSENDLKPYVHYETNNIDMIKKWKNYISEKNAAAKDCSFEGELIFKVYDDSTKMKFSLKPGCTVVQYLMNDSTFTKELTKEGIEYINTLKNRQ